MYMIHIVKKCSKENDQLCGASNYYGRLAEVLGYSANEELFFGYGHCMVDCFHLYAYNAIKYYSGWMCEEGFTIQILEYNPETVHVHMADLWAVLVEALHRGKEATNLEDAIKNRCISVINSNGIFLSDDFGFSCPIDQIVYTASSDVKVVESIDFDSSFWEEDVIDTLNMLAEKYGLAVNEEDQWDDPDKYYSVFTAEMPNTEVQRNQYIIAPMWQAEYDEL